MTDKSTFFYINYNNINSKILINKIEGKIYSLYTARKYLKSNLPEWMKTIILPSHEIDCAINEALIRFKTCLTVYKKNNLKFKMKMKTKKDWLRKIHVNKFTCILPKRKIKTDFQFLFFCYKH